MQSALAKGMKISLAVKILLAVAAGFLAWAVGPFGFLDKDVVSEIPAWILPGIIFGVFLLVPHSSWVSPGRVVAAIGTGVFAWVAAFAVGGLGWWLVGWLSFLAAGWISGTILGCLVPRLIRSRQYLRYLVRLSFAGFLGSIPFAMCFKTMNWENSFFAPQWVIPSFIFWNIVVAIALHLCATRKEVVPPSRTAG